MSRAVVRWFVSMASSKAGNQWCKQPAFCRLSVCYVWEEDLCFCNGGLGLKWMLSVLLLWVVSLKADSVGSILSGGRLSRVILIIHVLFSWACCCGYKTKDRVFQPFVLFWFDRTLNCFIYPVLILGCLSRQIRLLHPWKVNKFSVMYNWNFHTCRCKSVEVAKSKLRFYLNQCKIIKSIKCTFYVYTDYFLKTNKGKKGKKEIVFLA